MEFVTALLKTVIKKCIYAFCSCICFVITV